MSYREHYQPDRPMPSTTHSTAHLPDSSLKQRHPARLLNTLARRAGQWRLRQLLSSALELAGEPSLVLDLPCSTDDLWALLGSSNSRVVIAADANAEQLTQTLAGLDAALIKRVHPLQTSGLAIELGAIELGQNAVDCIVCLHTLQQIGDAHRRLTLLREFNRVSRDSVIISTWVDGNLQAWRQAEPAGGNGVIRSHAQIEGEFIQAGFRIGGHRDFFPGVAMLRLYVLHKRS